MEYTGRLALANDLAIPPRVHPTVVIVGDVEISSDASVGPYCVLTGPIRIEAGCRIGAGCLIGGAPEHRSLDACGSIVIGSGTVLHEYCVIHHGTMALGTRIGSNCYIMNRTYIAHDCQLANEITISAGTTLGGHVHIHRGANLGMQVSVHQCTTIGAYAMIGMSTPVCKDVPPLSLVFGNPMRFRRANQHAIRRLQLGDKCVAADSRGLVYPANHETISPMVVEFVKDSNRPTLFELRYLSSHLPRKPR